MSFIVDDMDVYLLPIFKQITSFHKEISPDLNVISVKSRLITKKRYADNSTVETDQDDDDDDVKRPFGTMMLNLKARNCLIGLVKSGYYFGSLPYRWDKETQKFIYNDSILYKIIWYIHNIIYNIYMTYVIIRWAQMTKLHGSSSSIAIATLYIFSSYQGCSAVQWSIYNYYGQHHLWLKIYMEYIIGLERVYGHQKSKSGHIKDADCAKICRTFCVLGVIVFCLDTLSVFDQPHQPFFISSLLPNPHGLTTIEILPFALFHCYIWVHQWHSYLFYIICMLTYLTSLKNALTLIRCTADETLVERTIQKFRNQSKRRKNIDDDQELELRTIGGSARVLKSAKDNDMDRLMREIENAGTNDFMQTLQIGKNPQAFSSEFREIEILQCFCNNIWSTTNALYETLFIGGAVMGFYGAVRQKGARQVQQIVVASFITSTLMCIWQSMGMLHEHCIDILHSWKTMEGVGWFRRFQKSIRPIRVNIGNFFFADRGIRLTILAIIFERTTSLLLSSGT